MSREILFRGQTRRNGEKVKNFRGDPMPSEWVYGGIFPQNNGGDFSIIYTYEPIDKRVVYTDTVGEYTGLRDRNGRKIFEGDIVDILTENEEIGVIKWDNDTARFVIESDGFFSDFDNYYGTDLEIIGNIYDNPELLEEE